MRTGPTSRLLAVAVAAVALGAASTSVADGSSRHPRKQVSRLTCAHSGHLVKTVASDRGDRLFSVDHNNEGEYGSDVYLYGCLRPVGRAFLLGTLDTVYGHITEVTMVAFGGGCAAYRTSQTEAAEGKYLSEQTYSLGLTVVSLRTGRVVVSQLLGSYTQSSAAVPPHADVVTLKVSARGQAAWVVQRASQGAALYAHDSHGTGLLDSNVDPHSLAFAGSTLSWTSAGARKNATLN